jgi:hypothetical protein
MSLKRRTNIDNFNPDSLHVKINSPRSLEAMRRLGVVMEDLQRVNDEQVIYEVKE